MIENKGKYFVYYNIINNTYCIDSKESSVGKNFLNIGKIKLTDQEVSEIKTSSNDKMYIKKENKEARENIYGKVEGFIDFSKVQKAIAQLCYNFKTNENYKYEIKKEEKEIQIKEEEINENGEATTEGEKINIYSIKYKKFEELCNNLLEIINNPPFKDEESNTNFLINYTVGLEKIIIDKIIEVGEESIGVDEKKKKIYSLLDYFSEKLFDVYDKIKETKNYGKVIYINCLFSIYKKILKNGRSGNNENLKSNIWEYAGFFKKTINKIFEEEKRLINKGKYRHFYIYKKDKKEEYYVVEYENGEENISEITVPTGYEYIKEVFLGESDISKFEKADGIGKKETVISALSSAFSYFSPSKPIRSSSRFSTNQFGAKEVKPISNKGLDYDYNYAPYSEVYARPVVDEAIEEEIKKIKKEEEERKRKEEEEKKKREEEEKKKREEEEKKKREEEERLRKEEDGILECLKEIFKETEETDENETTKKAAEEEVVIEEGIEEIEKKQEKRLKEEANEKGSIEDSEEESTKEISSEEFEGYNISEEEEEERKKKEKEKELVQQIILPSPKPQISINKNDGIIEKIIRYLPLKDNIKTEDTGSKKLLKEIEEDIYNLQINEMVDEEAKKYSEETRKSREEIAGEIKKDKENEIKEECLKKETEYTVEAFRRKYGGKDGQKYEYEKEYIEGGKVKIKIKNYFGDEKDLEMITSEPLQTLENFAKDIIDGKLKQDNGDIIEKQDDKYIYKNIYENIHEKKPIPNFETLEKSKDNGSSFQER